MLSADFLTDPERNFGPLPPFTVDVHTKLVILIHSIGSTGHDQFVFVRLLPARCQCKRWRLVVFSVSNEEDPHTMFYTLIDIELYSFILIATHCALLLQDGRIRTESRM